MNENNYTNINYKAVPVAETIMNLRRIFHNLGVFAFEKKWWEINNKDLSSAIASVKIALDDNDKVSTSGKGVNRHYALASGLAEMLERLQNLQFTQDVRSCTEEISYNYCDSKKVSRDKIKTLKYFLPKYKQYLSFLVDKKKEITVVPFYNVFKDTVEYFPYELLWCCAGSNGMCAGNTPQEALIQGLCEIMERHILYKIYFENLTLPTVPEDLFKGTRHWQHISILKEKGFAVEIKDCSLGGIFPVMGILVSKKNKATFCAGSAPDFDIALERCFTENMQGRNMDILYDSMPEIRNKLSEKELLQQYKLALTSHSGILPENIFKNEKQTNKNHLFWTADATSKDTLNKLISALRKMNYDLFVRDVSFLGFPAYYILVPKMSDMMPDYNRVLSVVRLGPNFKKTFFNLETANKKDLADLAMAINEKIQYSKKYNVSFNLLGLFGLSYRENSPLSEVSSDIFLIVLYCKLKAFNEALAHLSSFLKKHPPENKRSNDAFSCFKEMLVLLKKGILSSEVNEKLAHKYPSGILQENSLLLDERYPLNKIFGVPEPDNCPKCNVCYFKELQDLALKLKRSMANYDFNQLQLKDILACAPEIANGETLQ